MSIIVNVDNGIATICLNQESRRNALTHAMRREITTIFADLQHDGGVRAAVLIGAGEHFCAGADLAEPYDGGIPGSLARIEGIGQMILTVAGLNKPVVAAVSGACAGLGWSLALACDMVVTADDARFQFAFSKVGLAPGGGAVHLLTRHVGLMRAKEIAYSGRVVSGREAATLGLAIEAVPAADVPASARRLALQFMGGAPLSIAMTKRQFADVDTDTLAQAIATETIMQPLLARSADFAEGVASFKEKRPPRFNGA